VDGATVAKPDIDRVAQAAFDRRRELIEALWDDCTEDMRADLAEFQRRAIPMGEIPDERARELQFRGFAKPDGNALRCGCTLMGRHASQKSGGVENLRRLFGDAERFQSNIRSLLEVRLSQIPIVDVTLRNFVQKAIRDLDEPAHAVVWARSIAERALDMIWEKELPKDREFPSDWIAEWKFAGVKWAEELERLPPRRGAQCGVLRLITGTEDTKRLTKYVSKPTYLLVDHIQAIGDFGQHPSDPVTLPFAASFCYSAIELCESIQRDFTSV
jgi:hypothetical protein